MMSLFCKCADQMEAYKKAMALEMENFNASIRDMHRRLNEAIKECTTYKVDRLNGNISIIVNKALKKLDERINLLENKKPQIREIEVLPYDFTVQMKNMIIRIEAFERRLHKQDNELEDHIGILLNHVNKNDPIDIQGPKVSIKTGKQTTKKDDIFKTKLAEALANNTPPKRKPGRPRKVKNEQKAK